MTGTWLALGLLQALGAVSLIPYPAILAANVMGIAGAGPSGLRRLKASLPYLMLSLYPLVWILLYISSWRAMSLDQPVRAFLLSGIPVVASLTGVAFYLASNRADANKIAHERDSVRKQIEAANPLVWILMQSGGPDRWPLVSTALPEAEVLQAIAAATNLNGPAGEYGSPLEIALWNINANKDGSPSKPRHDEFLRIARALRARGAKLTPAEESILRNVFLLRLAMHDGPVNTASENPLAWRIVRATAAEQDAFALREDEKPFLNKPSTIHGTPLFAALLTLNRKIPSVLIAAGARLSPEEESSAAGRRALEDFFRGQQDLRDLYQRR